jgi:siroheme decarboxylase
VDAVDRTILNEIQSDFPISPRPYQELGKRLNLPEKEVLDRVKALKAEGIIRRIGGNFNSRMLNFKSTLCAAKVPQEKLNEFVLEVNRHPGVTHNYLRSHEFNVWFTFIAPSMGYIEKALREIRKATGVNDILNLPALRTCKIKVDFDV